MKTKFIFLSFILVLLTAFMVNCKKDEGSNQNTSSDVISPDLKTNLATNISQNSATCGGSITNNYGSEITAKGICWSLSKNPTIANNKTNEGSGSSDFSSNINNLESNKIYYYRAYATSQKGTGYGNEEYFFTCQNCGNLNDVDGNIYHTVIIGSQCWMRSNLKVTKYNDFTNISKFILSENYANYLTLNSAAYFNLKNDESISKTYGRLYNWFAVNSNKLCPTGWHVPSQIEWSTLLYNIGGYENTGIKLKANFSWLENGNGTDDYGFSALAGASTEHGDALGYCAAWWTSTPYPSSDDIYNYEMFYNSNHIGASSKNKNQGYSVRCIKDN